MKWRTRFQKGLVSMSILLQRVECMKDYSRLAGLAQESEARGDWQDAAVLWEKAAEIGQQINHSENAKERAKACYRRFIDRKNGHDNVTFSP